MNKYLILMTGMAVAVMVSCSREKDVTAGSGEAITVTVEALAQETAIQQKDASKTYLGTFLGQANTVLWGSDEQMQLAITSGGTSVFAASVPTSAYDGQASAAFSFTINPVTASSYLYQGIYPASVVAASENENPARYKVVLPGVQNASAGAYDPAAYIMIAQPADFDSKSTSWTASFRRATALNCITLKNLPAGKSFNRIELIAPEGVYLSGGREMNLSTGASGDIYAGGRSVEVKYATPLAGGADVAVWFTSWGADFTVGQTFSVAAYTSEKESFAKEIVVPDGHPISFEEGKLNTLMVDMDGITPSQSYFSGGLGTAESPWKIETVADLAEMADYVGSTEDAYMHFHSDYYRQTADIDYAGGTHNSIGNSNATSPYSFFSGTYEGNGYKISNLVITNPQSKKAVGFFGYLDGTAHIDGLLLENVTLNSTTWNNGAIAGCVQSTSSALIENCHVTGATITGSDECNGGLVGKLMAGNIRHCSFQGSVTATNSAKQKCGGIVGYSSGTASDLEDCHLLPGSAISGAGERVGGIVGEHTGGNILSCSVTGSGTTVSGGTRMVGGIVGYVTNNANYRRIENCTVNCKEIKATRGIVGGIIGDIEAPATINLCTVSCDVINETNGSDSSDNGAVGGIIGQIYDNGKTMVIANSCFVDGVIDNTASVKGNVGGIVGNANVKVMNYVTIFNCCTMPSQVKSGSSNQNLGGIAGYCADLIMRNCYSATPYTAYTFNGAVIDPASNQSNGCLYGWQRGGNEAQNANNLAGVVQDCYWISGFKAGRYSTAWVYTKSEQELSDAQMRNSGSVIRPSSAEVYANFLAALNADAADWNAAPPAAVEASTWVIGANGYPVPQGPAASESTIKKRVSILGDSISTYQGYTPYPSNYQYPKGSYADFTSVTQTWWHKLIYQKMSNAKLEVNSSYTGTCVQETTDKGHPGYGFLHRYVELGNPDVIIVNGGTNDAWSFNLPVGTLDFSIATDNLDEFQFAQAYDKLIRLLKTTYPNAQIACVIGDNVMDAQYSTYAQVIRDVCDHYSLPYAEVVFADRAASTYDNVHPNPSGMADMADQIWNALQPAL
jgi:lysophospholipase L1-like esterase